MIRYLEEQEKRRSRDLWEEAFPEDSRSFADYYFTEKLRDNRILVREEAGEIDAMIQLNPYRVRAAREEWNVDYLVGVATRKSCRHRGYMRSLLLRMMTDMRAAGMPFCFLMPADEAIYRPFGFTYIYRQPVYQLRPEKTLQQIEWLRLKEPQESPEDSGTLEELASWMNRWLSERYEVFAVRDRAYVQRLLKELASEQGSFRLLYDAERLVGMIGSWGLEKQEQRLLYCEDAYVQEARPPRPAIMARIISPERFVRAVHLRQEYPAEEAVIRLRLTDSLIAENDGPWEWHLNRETSWLERCDSWELALTAEELTAWLFGYQIPENAKAFQSVVRPLQGVFLDEVV